MIDLTEAELSNLITACMTSSMRRDPAWGECLNAISEKLREARAVMDRMETEKHDGQG